MRKNVIRLSEWYSSIVNLLSELPRINFLSALAFPELLQNSNYTYRQASLINIHQNLKFIVTFVFINSRVTKILERRRLQNFPRMTSIHFPPNQSESAFAKMFSSSLCNDFGPSKKVHLNIFVHPSILLSINPTKKGPYSKRPITCTRRATCARSLHTWALVNFLSSYTKTGLETQAPCFGRRTASSQKPRGCITMSRAAPGRVK